jgi:hypothetical protein
MATEVEKAFYCSSNGDQWYLIEEPRLKKMCVRHQPNLASGGKSSVIDVSAFLSEGHGPQHEALLRLLAKANQQNGEQHCPGNASAFEGAASLST